ncbi:MAG TPA: response regulator [Nitrososphaeraceae archaeon]
MKRILVLDDEKDNAYLFALILEDHGYVVDTYTNPIKALAEFKAGCYDLMILDYRMAKLNGPEFFQKIRVLDKSAKAIILTAGHEQLHLDDDHKLFLKVLGKPISAKTLLKEVALVIG